MFTVPPGGDGVYYFSTFLLVDQGEFARFDIRLNDNLICAAQGDQSNNGDADVSQAACGAVAEVSEGIFVFSLNISLS